MTRLKHIFRHLCSAAKRQHSRNWAVFEKAASAEKAHLRWEIRAQISELEDRIHLLKKKGIDDALMLRIEARILALKLALAGKD